MSLVLTDSKVDAKLLRRGKVRDVYDLGDKLLLVATDRLSAFDCILPTPIPDKGKLLTQCAAKWFELTKHIVPNHLISTSLKDIPVKLGPEYEGRVMLCKKADRVDAECVARGYVAGSGWKTYEQTGRLLDHTLPAGLREAGKLPNPIFTPATKNDEGHDENITRAKLAEAVGADTAKQLEELTLKLYDFASDFLAQRGLILADTKFEFGFVDGKLIVIDEMLTPDSSRVWDAKAYREGSSPASFDKQFVRDHLERTGWNKLPPAPALPPEIAEGTAERYREYLRLISR